ncbi:urease accessory protein UreF [bacterium]|nr:urease accessory protein UreF [bacterium]
MTQSNSSIALMRVLQLASSNLPVGGYTFSQGLEQAIANDWLVSEKDVADWISGVAEATLTHTDLPLIRRQYRSVRQKDWASCQRWNEYALASRESKELLLADTAMGEALVRLAKGLDMLLPDFVIESSASVSFTCVYALVAEQLQLELEQALSAYCWTQLEGQVLAATKLLPMGQTAAQSMLYRLSASIADCVEASAEIGDEAIGLSLPAVAIASAQHEILYSRLYRS